jgi:hypothetical protein
VTENQSDHLPFLLSLRCVECGARWDDPVERRRTYFSDDEPPEPTSYCPDCAKREFDD